MNRWLYIGIMLLCLCSCKDKANTFVLDAHIGSLAHDTIYIYGADALHERIDTVVAQGGTFRYTATIDTVTPMWVLFPNKHREMVFADKGLTATMQGDTAAAGHISIYGGEQNELLRTFYKHTDSLDTQEVVAVAMINHFPNLIFIGHLCNQSTGHQFIIQFHHFFLQNQKITSSAVRQRTQ